LYPPNPSIEDFNQSISNLPQPESRIGRKSKQGWHAIAGHSAWIDTAARSGHAKAKEPA
jgi:hypothetical protein